MSTRESAKITGCDQKTVCNDLREENSSDNEENSSKRSPRDLLSQSDQPDWRTPRHFIDAVHALRGIGESGQEHGLLDTAPSLFAPAQRRLLHLKLKEMGMTTRESAKITGSSQRTVCNDLAEQNCSDNEQNCSESGGNATLSTRALLSQSDQNDWRTPRKYVEAARPHMTNNPTRSGNERSTKQLEPVSGRYAAILSQMARIMSQMAQSLGA